MPEDFAAALDAAPIARAAFDALSYSNKSAYVIAVRDAKTAETRRRRIDAAIVKLGGRPA
ncbi:MAG TPA: YdeI/OmpD-associated family protein [Candidatus Limnocylindrales bacterium]|nr:YdeI/OmpD-associated family protein [Candidatus Limnocylindrales bacterium]